MGIWYKYFNQLIKCPFWANLRGFDVCNINEDLDLNDLKTGKHWNISNEKN